MKRKDRVRLVAMKLMAHAGFVPMNSATFDIVENAKINPRAAQFLRNADDIIKALDYAQRKENKKAVV